LHIDRKYPLKYTRLLVILTKLLKLEERKDDDFENSFESFEDAIKAVQRLVTKENNILD
jgi:hypothetical protein